MISLDQVLLLQKKVETAVAKIKSLSDEVARLTADNAALRAKCAELESALSDKTGLVTSLEAEQDRIEESIMQALNQLDTVENALLGGGDEQPLVQNGESNGEGGDAASDGTGATYEGGQEASPAPGADVMQQAAAAYGEGVQNSFGFAEQGDNAAGSGEEAQYGGNDGAQAPQDGNGGNNEPINGQFDIF